MSKRRNVKEPYKYDGSSHRSSHYSSTSDDSSDTDDERKRPRKDYKRDDDGKNKIGSKPADNKFTGIKINLGPPKIVTETKPKLTVASVFNQDSDDEPEEMPKEARMKMRNIGRDTPTSAGPNSFGKTKQGFCHAKRVFEKSVEEALKDIDE